MAAAQRQLESAGIECQVQEAINPGVAGDAQVYEVACLDAPGYILVASEPPQTFNCLELAGSAYVSQIEDPEADTGQQCSLPANQNGLELIGGWAREAGVTCRLDEALAIGKTSGGETVYEVGCDGVDGYHLDKTAEGWRAQDCLLVVAGQGVCRFTTPDEQKATVQAKLAGTEAADCAVEQFRLMGQNDNGRFFEVKCAAAGEGYVARIKDDVAQQIYSCATAQNIGGGCTLTQTPAAATSEQ